MKTTWSWLQTHLSTQHTPEEIAALLTSTGTETEVLDPVWAKEFFVVQVEDVQKHPQADSLSVCRVPHGGRTLTIVCGAKNVRTGLITILALPGTVIPKTGVQLGTAVLRGIASEGMLCSVEELGIAYPCPEEGIIELPSSCVQGMTLYDVLKKDPVLESEVTPNRGDLLSVRGLARECAALKAGTLLPLASSSLPEEASVFPVSVQTTACSQFYTAYAKAPQIPPVQLSHRLISVGLKSISPLVDLTNFIAHDLGQPLHVFDAETIKGPLTLRLSEKGEPFEALDQITYTLPEGVIVLSDAEGIISLPGLIGGQRTAFQNHSTCVLLEGGYFDPSVIARAGQMLKIFTASRFRTERALDPEGVRPAFLTASHQLGMTAYHCAVPYQKKEVSISFSTEALPALTGVHLSFPEITERFEALGCKVDSSSDNTLRVKPPSWRNDWRLPEDCVEELIRLKGYKEIVPVPLDPQCLTTVSPDHTEQRGWHARRLLVEKGCYEVVTWSFMEAKKAALFAEGTALVSLANPLSQEWSTLRPSLIPNLLDTALMHRHHAVSFCPFFEWGPQFTGQHPGEQEDMISALFPCTKDIDWQPSKTLSFFDIKAVVEDLLFACKGPSLVDLTTDVQTPSYYHPGRSARLVHQGTPLAFWGQLHPRLNKLFPDPIWILEFFLSRIPLLAVQKTFYKPPVLQAVTRDLSFFLPLEAPVGPLMEAMRKAGGKTLLRLQLIDLFQTDGDQQKSIALRCTFQPTDHTFSEEELHHFMDDLIQCARQQGATLRGPWE